jgi:hypothetical protein
MPLEELLRVLRRQPFEPFRVHVTDGSNYEVRHPEIAMPGARSVIIGFRGPNQLLPVYDDFVIVDLVHITRIEPIAVAPSNGQP